MVSKDLFKRNLLIKVIAVAFVIFLLPIIITGAFLFVFHQEYSILDWTIQRPETRNLPSSISFEKDGSLFQKDFEIFKIFFKDNVDLEKINQVSNSEIVIKKDFSLKEKIVNDCKEINCFQHRVHLNQYPVHLWKSLISVEDIRYLDHTGIDVHSIARAALKNIISLKFKEGASTLTQQLVKNLFLTGEKTFIRKLKEAFISIYIEIKYTKKEIIEIYLNEMFFGTVQDIRIKGVYSASIFYFNKRPSELSPYESFILVSLLKGPSLYSPLKRSELLKKRIDSVVSLIKKSDFFQQAEIEIWSQQKYDDWILKLQEESIYKRQRCFLEISSSEENINYDSYAFCIQSKVILGKLTKEKIKYDWSVKFAAKNLSTNRKIYFYSKNERDQNKALKSERHSIGSTIKPLVYSTFIDLGLNILQPRKFNKIEMKLKSGTWSPKEASKFDFQEEITPLVALKKSLNNPIVEMANEFGMDRVQIGLNSFFITQEVKDLIEYPSQILGTIELSLEELLSAYELLIEKDCERYKKNEQSILTLISDTEGTTFFNRLAKPLVGAKFVGKTGTTNNGLDNWFIFITGDILGAIWVGIESRRPAEDTKTFGSSTAFEIFQNWQLHRGNRIHDFSCNATSNL